MRRHRPFDRLSMADPSDLSPAEMRRIYDAVSDLVRRMPGESIRDACEQRLSGMWVKSAGSRADEAILSLPDGTSPREQWAALKRIADSAEQMPTTTAAVPAAASTSGCSGQTITTAPDAEPRAGERTPGPEGVGVAAVFKGEG